MAKIAKLTISQLEPAFKGFYAKNDYIFTNINALCIKMITRKCTIDFLMNLKIEEKFLLGSISHLTEQYT